MKRKVYLNSKDEKILKEFDSNTEKYTAEEHSYLQRQVITDPSREGFFRERLLDHINKLAAYEFLIPLIKEKGYKNIVSLGSGDGILEYLMKLCLPEDCKVVATDFDSYLVEKAKSFFPEIISETFNFFNDDFELLEQKIKLKPDIVLFINSSYVMEDQEFVNLFTQIKNSGVQTVVDIYAGYIGVPEYIYYLLRPIKSNSVVRKLLGKSTIISKGKAHGFSRSRKELLKLYKKSGFQMVSKYSHRDSKFIAVLEAK